MQNPQITLHWGSIAAAIAATFVIGAIWFGPLLGKTWAKLEGLKMDKKPSSGEMLRLMGVHTLGIFLSVFVMAHTLPVWRPSVWGAGADLPNGTMIYYGTLFTWIGFSVPQHIRRSTWGGKPWKLFAVNAGYDLVWMSVVAAILTCWR